MLLELLCTDYIFQCFLHEIEKKIKKFRNLTHIILMLPVRLSDY